jgi:hypothetical protein
VNWVENGWGEEENLWGHGKSSVTVKDLSAKAVFAIRVLFYPAKVLL